MATVSIRESGIPRLYRTVWLQSGVGPDSGTLASKLMSSLAGYPLGQEAAPPPPNESVGYLEAWVLLKATGDLATPLDPAVYWWDDSLISAFNRWSVRRTVEHVDLTPDLELSDPDAPNPDFMLISPAEVFYQLAEEAVLPQNEARLFAALREADIEAAGFIDDLRTRVPRPPKPEPEAPPGPAPRKPIWPALVALGIIGGGIWALWKGQA
ncbi:MAG: hypothetical protein ACRD1X_17985 [Vicinamibacteria bacterium]